MQLCCETLLRDEIASVTGRVAQPFNSRATLFPNRALLYSVQLCRKNAERLSVLVNVYHVAQCK